MPVPLIWAIRWLMNTLLVVSQWVNGFDPRVYPHTQLSSLNYISTYQRFQQLDYGIKPVPQKRSRREVLAAWLQSVTAD